MVWLHSSQARGDSQISGRNVGYFCSPIDISFKLKLLMTLLFSPIPPAIMYPTYLIWEAIFETWVFQLDKKCMRGKEVERQCEQTDGENERERESERKGRVDRRGVMEIKRCLKGR